MHQSIPANTRNIIAACAAITVFGLAFGMTYPLLSLILESRGVSTEMIGINSAMMPIGILLFSSVIPTLSKRFGSRNVAIVAALATALLVLSYKIFDSLEAWFLIRLLQGMTISTLFVLSEAWIVGFAGSANRGKIVAIYASALSLSFGLGPAIIGWIGIEGWAPFVIGALILLLGVFPLYLVREENSKQPEEKSASGFFQFFPKAPMLLVAVFSFAIFDAATLSLLPVYSLQNGLSVSVAAGTLTALIIGNAVLQFPVGWLADRYPHRHILNACALITALGLFVLPVTMNTVLMWPLLVLIGTAGYGMYTVSLTSLGDRFEGDELVDGSASFAVMWGLGALLGSLSGGWAMSLFGAHGLPVHLGVIYLIFTAGMVVRGRSLARQTSSG